MPNSFEERNNSKPLHERLQALQNIGLTQAKLAQEINCSQNNVCYLSSGKAKKPRPSYAVVIAVRRLEEKYRTQLQHTA